MIRTLSLSLLFLFLLSFFCSSLQAWSIPEHEIVAVIAYHNLTPIAKNKVNYLLNIPVFGSQEGFPALANWPDTLRRNGINAFNSWHYIDQPFIDTIPFPHRLLAKPSSTTLLSPEVKFSKKSNITIDPVDPHNIVWAIQESIQVLAHKHNPYEKAFFLRFLIHLVGDIHQPLHCINRITIQNPKGDEGGTLFYLTQNYSLHALWDQALGLYRDFDKTNNKNAYIQEKAYAIERIYPVHFFQNQNRNTNLVDWENESFAIAKDFAYKTAEYQWPNTRYIHKGEILVQERLALAGYRLAFILNELFSS